MRWAWYRRDGLRELDVTSDHAVTDLRTAVAGHLVEVIGSSGGRAVDSDLLARCDTSSGNDKELPAFFPICAEGPHA